MKRIISNRVLIGLAMIVLFAAPTSAQQSALDLPTLEPQSLAVIRFDLKQIDLAATNQWIVECIAQSKLDPSAQKQLLDDINPILTKLVQIQKGLLAAGASTLVVSFNATDLYSYGGQPILCVPLAPNANIQAIRSILYSGKPEGSQGSDPDKASPNDQVAAVQGQGVILARAATYARLKNNPGPAPAELSQALAAVPAVPVQIVAAIPADISRAFEEAVPQLPPPFDAPTATLTRGMRSITVTIGPPPNPSIGATIQSQDAADAANLKQLIDRLPQIMNDPDWNRLLAGELWYAVAMWNLKDPTIARQFAAVDRQAVIAALSPRVQGDRLTIQLDGASLRQTITAALIAAWQSRQMQLIRVSMSQLRQIGMGIAMYINDHKGALPDRLDQIAPYYQPTVLINPRGKNGNTTYVYRKAVQNFNQLRGNEGNTILVYENPDELPTTTDVVVAAFADGHAEALPRDQFLQRLEDTKLTPSSETQKP